MTEPMAEPITEAKVAKKKRSGTTKVEKAGTSKLDRMLAKVLNDYDAEEDMDQTIIDAKTKGRYNQYTRAASETALADNNNITIPPYLFFKNGESYGVTIISDLKKDGPVETIFHIGLTTAGEPANVKGDTIMIGRPVYERAKQINHMWYNDNQLYRPSIDKDANVVKYLSLKADAVEIEKRLQEAIQRYGSKSGITTAFRNELTSVEGKIATLYKTQKGKIEAFLSTNRTPTSNFIRTLATGETIDDTLIPGS